MNHTVTILPFLNTNRSASIHIHINIDPNRNQIIPNLLRTKLLIASKHISRHALVIMKQKGLRCMLSSDCTKASNPFRGLHFLINPRNWQDMNNLTYTSRCIDAGGYLHLFNGFSCFRMIKQRIMVVSKIGV